MATLTFIGHSTFTLQTDDGTKLVIDPFLTDNPVTEVTPEDLEADFIWSHMVIMTTWGT